jgi:raffinose/stachyose/melibiose transport system substrate-binding protein
VLAGGAWAISSKSKQTDAARKYLAFWAQDKNLGDWLTSANAFSPLKGGVVALPEEMKPFSDAAADDRTVSFPFSDWPADFQTPYADATLEAMQGKDLTKTLQTLDQAFSKK